MVRVWLIIHVSLFEIVLKFRCCFFLEIYYIKCYNICDISGAQAERLLN